LPGTLLFGAYPSIATVYDSRIQYLVSNFVKIAQLLFA